MRKTGFFSKSNVFLGMQMFQRFHHDIKINSARQLCVKCLRGNMKKVVDNCQYQKAEEIKLSWRKQFEHLIRLMIIIVNTFWLLFLEFTYFIRDLFRTVQPECVKGQLCLVTGGANGLGRELALQFAAAGCNIAIVDVEKSDSVVEEISEKFKVECKSFKCDVSDNDAILRMKDEVEASLGAAVDILVNNAGILLTTPLLHCEMADIQKCVDVNLMAHFKVRFK